MKLLSLKFLSDFRNLKKELKVDFNLLNHTTSVIIGNNGTGKTNILEALSSIFAVLYAHTNTFLFEFEITYKIDNDIYKVKHSQGITEYKKNKVSVNESDMVFPNRVVCNYSGEDVRMWEDYYKKPYEDYISSVRVVDTLKTLSMVYIDRTKWQYVLLCMLIARGEIAAFDNFLSKKLRITSDSNIRVDVVFDENVLRDWTVQNQITLFLSQLKNTLGVSLSSTNLLDYNPNNDGIRELFSKYVGASDAISSLRIFFNDGVESAFLSEGEKKMMVIIFILEAIADEKTLVLMDEPDSHIHISRKKDICDMFCQLDNRCNVITSHSPTLAASFAQNMRDSIIAFDDDGHRINNDMFNVVEKLTDGQWTFHNQNLFLASNDDIFIVEGITDKIFISTALKHFQEKGEYVGMSFEFIPCGGASNVKEFAQKFIPKENQMIYCFFDGDSAGVSNMKKICPNSGFDEDEQGYINWFGKARKVGKTWFSFYPPYATREDTKHFNVEDYFTCELFKKYLTFTSLDTIPDKKHVKDMLKQDCEKGVGVKGIEEQYFNEFKTLFDHIIRIKEAEHSGETNI